MSKLVVLLDDGMAMFFDMSQQKVERVLLSHTDAINDLIILDYIQSGTNELQIMTGSKDKTLRQWVLDAKPSTNHIDIDLKRITYFEGTTNEDG